jgi:hypothetical protein
VDAAAARDQQRQEEKFSPFAILHLTFQTFQCPLQVELWTQPQHHVTSSVKKSTRNPNWKNQRLEVLVQEPDSQQLRLVLQDIDMLNFKVG